jgi:hypothetical protein
MVTRIAAVAATLLGAAAPAQQAALPYAQVTISQSLIIRVPMKKPAAAVEWREKRGPDCIAASALAGAQINSSDHVDLILQGGERLRAMLKDDCPSLRYYAGFYLRPGADGRICADRDTLHTRSGGECEIDSFRSLVAKKAKRR